MRWPVRKYKKISPGWRLERTLRTVIEYAEHLKGAQYSTAFFGKNHETAPWEVSVPGPTDR
jgi:hypothetical protein